MSRRAPLPTASVLIPTRGRPQYLEVALSSIAPQARRAGAEVLVIGDGEDPSAGVAARHGVSFKSLARPSGLNAARNAGVRSASAELLVFVDDDVLAPPEWLESYLLGAAAAPGHDVFGGPIRARLEGRPPRACGRERPPITTLDFGDQNRDVPHVWGANMAIRAEAMRRIGPFEEAVFGTGDEEEWLQRYRAAKGRIRYLASAGLEHRRTPADSTVARLARAAYARGQTARRYDVNRNDAPRIPYELQTLAGCGWHAVRWRCALGIVSAAHSAGRLRQAVRRTEHQTAGHG